MKLRNGIPAALTATRDAAAAEIERLSVVPGVPRGAAGAVQPCFITSTFVG